MTAPRRRTPRQARSRATVERILDATARVLERDGYAAATTNRVAAEAGVSPGSLYQYFADREDLLVALTARFLRRFEAALAPALRGAAALDPAAASEVVIRATLEALEAQAPVLRALVAHVPGERQAELLRGMRARVADHVFLALARALPDPDPATLERYTWLVVEVAQALPVRYVVERPPIDREAFVADAVSVVVGLSARAAAAAS
ncbi:TetR/AcrR family transcriptional regulator [Patulibacter sp. S7RM1-6]